ncbi:FKBP-type peptidyl-prolyl cis-trans isomerase [Mucilaginibacter sp. BJC16-A38]|uniref:FKBP-type peptidyl-prolyl cis-trans isomerase n=1 Tax=Mucilaginibacter phenanthrenivorans TaxID=1234842 RepID=UPI0021580B72|nr:FKBP-type peptidyl-prolyl cis-trans isomerase [Mucilaginibacter phenanthrenivorans]MCR8557908.1 FKBP-type peptidyl-prolyl cis-trans isomerase [Mucilaginibacter phenanthrenivorans]
MRQKFFTLLLISAIGFASCRKDKIEQTIKQYDESQMQNYIKVHGLTGMQKDTIGGDTSGIYYKIIMPGNIVPPATTLVPLDYPDNVSFVFQLSSFDGRYITLDTIQNHIDDYLGHLTNDALPSGLQLAIKKLVKYKGASARILIPSHLAYGVNGYGSGSSSVTNTKIAGNQCLDYYVHLISDYTTYDDQVIHNNWNLTGYTKMQSDALPGNYYYYKVLTPGTTGAAPITETTTMTVNYTGSLLNGTIFDGSNNGANTIEQPISQIALSGLKEALEKFATTGTKISVILPSKLAYGTTSAGTIPINSVLRFSYVIISTVP